MHTLRSMVFLVALTPLAAAETASLRFESPAQSAAAAPAPAAETAKLEKALDDQPSLRFAQQGWWGWSLGGGVAFDSNSTDYNTGVTFHHFLADRFEINFGVGGWYYDQDGENAIGVNPAFGFRYHFWMPKDTNDRSWSMYADIGIGLLFADHNVPQDGTQFDFTPRAGIGATFEISDTGTRLDIGLRWAHVSNANINGSDDNPSRDSVMVHGAVIFPF